MRAKDRRRHAAIQRLHVQRYRERGVPRREDIARAFLEAARRDLAAHRIVNVARAESGLWKRLFNGTVAVLVERGFDRESSILRLMRILRPTPSDSALPAEDPVPEE